MGTVQDTKALLHELAELVSERNQVEAKMATLMGRPVHPGHFAEFVAAQVFGIEPLTSTPTRGSDGYFAEGPLQGHSVSVKFYPRNVGLLDINPKAVPDYYLICSGPFVGPVSSRGIGSPWTIEHVYLFDAAVLLKRLRQRMIKVGISTSIIRHMWEAAEIYPHAAGDLLPLSPEQRGLLGLFHEGKVLA